MSTVQGIDVSHFQGVVDWQQVAQAGMAFAFAKATDGITYTDPDLATNWAGIQAAGLLRGAYHFFEPNDDATAQAQHFLTTVKLAAGDLPPVLDVEITGGVSNAQIWSGVSTWLGIVEQATGRQPLIYTAPGFWNTHEPDLTLSSYPLWLADYATQPTLPTGWTSWLFWQHSQTGTVAGVTGSVDLDLFNGSLDQLQALASPAASRSIAASQTQRIRPLLGRTKNH